MPTDELEVIPCGIVFRSVGYRGVALPGVPFDEARGDDPERGRPRVDDGGEPGRLLAGWIKRGPSGVIGTNKKDATETVELLLEDAARGSPLARRRRAPKLEACSSTAACDFVEYAGWEAIDGTSGAGEPHGRPRIKLATWDELLERARESKANAEL